MEKEEETSQGEGGGDKSGRRSRRQVREEQETSQRDKPGRQVSPLLCVQSTIDCVYFNTTTETQCSSPTDQRPQNAALQQTSGHRVQHSNRPAAGRKKTDQPQTRGPGPRLTSCLPRR